MKPKPTSYVKPKTLANRFKLQKSLGSGSFGEIYQSKDIKTNQLYAIKLESLSVQFSWLKYEKKIYDTLHEKNTAFGVPRQLVLLVTFVAFTVDKHIFIRVYFSGIGDGYNWLVLELLGESLESLFQQCNRCFSLKTVLMLGKQMLTRLEFIHSKEFLHRDIKPDNFLMGPTTKTNQVYIIDFGLSRRYKTSLGEHIPFRTGKSLTGTVRYASINCQKGEEQGRRDDMESLGYVLIYFLQGKLPWQGILGTTKRERQTKILQKKKSVTLNQLCIDQPSEFIQYLEYCKTLKFTDEPDYFHLQNLMDSMLADHGYDFDYEYDWCKGKSIVLDSGETSHKLMQSQMPLEIICNEAVQPQQNSMEPETMKKSTSRRHKTEQTIESIQALPPEQTQVPAGEILQLNGKCHPKSLKRKPQLNRSKVVVQDNLNSIKNSSAKNNQQNQKQNTPDDIINRDTTDNVVKTHVKRRSRHAKQLSLNVEEINKVMITENDEDISINSSTKDWQKQVAKDDQPLQVLQAAIQGFKEQFRVMDIQKDQPSQFEQFDKNVSTESKLPLGQQAEMDNQCNATDSHR